MFGNEAAQGDITRFAERFGCVVIDSYGSTEGGAVVQRTPDTPPGALGRGPEGTMVVDPVTGEQRAVARFDDSGRLVNPEESIGELVSKGGGAGFEGYWRNEEAETARSRNGWYWTGDLAYQDDNGFFYFAGRSDDWLRVDGENFAAAPVTRILERHRDVVVGSVYAVPDPAVGRPGHGGARAAPRGHLRPGRVRPIPRRPGRPRNQVRAPLHPGVRRAADHGHLQGARADAAGRALELRRPGVVAARSRGRPRRNPLPPT